MAGSSGDQRDVPAYVALVRIGTVIGMAGAVAFGIFLIVGGWWLAGLIAIALAAPCFAVMRLVEGPAEPPRAPPSD
ncbi:MAG: hypothetical protein A2148_06870 [Chloroflexi bacterium RBG_16_68_14]|nr:MAG: hypothetical protein A2148_06870 [Chloroflexi bacterium RBG_16_68_14]